MAHDTSPRLSPNLGLLDANATGRTFFELGNHFLPVDFFDLCSMIEEMVMRNGIVLVGKYDKLKRDYRKALEPFRRDGVFIVCMERAAIKKLGEVPKGILDASRHVHAAGMTSSSIHDSNMEVTRLLGAEATLNLPTIPLLRHLHNYGFTRRRDVDHTICDLSARFEDLSAMVEEKLRFEAQNTKTEQVRVPLLAMEVLRRVQHFDDLPNAILEVRYEFRRLREAATTLAAKMNDPATNYESYLDNVRDWNRRWQDVGANAVAVNVGLGLSSFSALGRGAEIVQALSTLDPLGTAVSMLSVAGDVIEFRKNRLFRPVYYTVRNYMQHRHLISQTIGRIFEMDPWLIDHQLALIGSRDSVWRNAMNNLIGASRGTTPAEFSPAGAAHRVWDISK